MPKYELVKKDILDDVCGYLLEAENLLNKSQDKEFRVSAKERIVWAYRTIQENRKVDKCVHCGYELPRDVEFQEAHMLKVHGLIC